MAGSGFWDSGAYFAAQQLEEHALLAGRIAWFYAGKLVWPFGLSFMYPRWELDAGSIVQWLYPVTDRILLIK